MSQRLDDAHLGSGGMKALVDRVHLRMSQVNGCADCIDKHSRDRLKGEMAVEKLVLVPAWREAGDLFSEKERAALRWVETVTRVAGTVVPDAEFGAASGHFNDKELADLTTAIGLQPDGNQLRHDARGRRHASLRQLPRAEEHATMSQSSRAIRATAAAVLAAGVFIASLTAITSAGAAGADEKVSRTRAFETKLPNVPGKTLTALVVTYAPGGKSVKHHHAGSVYAYVLSGEIRSETSATGPATVYKAGESFFEPPGSEHLVSENASATEPASLLAVFVADDGAVLKSDDE